jgi:hypothetical protein
VFEKFVRCCAREKITGFEGAGSFLSEVLDFGELYACARDGQGEFL